MKGRRRPERYHERKGSSGLGRSVSHEKLPRVKMGMEKVERMGGVERGVKAMVDGGMVTGFWIEGLGKCQELWR
jgi:hypothetical protein